jgi:hypothetical protein
MDALAYASVERRTNPALGGGPVAVGRGARRGLVAAPSDEARQFSLRAAYPEFCLSGFLSIQIAGLTEFGYSGFHYQIGRESAQRDALMATEPSQTFENAAADADKGQTLNFKVSAAFKKEFKGYAVAQGISMTDLLKEGFALSKKERQR